MAVTLISEGVARFLVDTRRVDTVSDQLIFQDAVEDLVMAFPVAEQGKRELVVKVRGFDVSSREARIRVVQDVVEELAILGMAGQVVKVLDCSSPPR